MSWSVSGTPIIGVLWYDQQALSCSVQQAPGGWSVSLWKSGLPDPVSDDPDLDGMKHWTLPDPDVQMPVCLDGLTIYQAGTGWTIQAEQVALMVSSSTLTCHSRTLLNRSDAVLLSSRLRQKHCPVLYSTGGRREINQNQPISAVGRPDNNKISIVFETGLGKGQDRHQAIQDGQDRPTEPAGGLDGSGQALDSRNTANRPVVAYSDGFQQEQAEPDQATGHRQDNLEPGFQTGNQMNIQGASL